MVTARKHQPCSHHSSLITEGHQQVPFLLLISSWEDHRIEVSLWSFTIRKSLIKKPSLKQNRNYCMHHVTYYYHQVAESTETLSLASISVWQHTGAAFNSRSPSSWELQWSKLVHATAKLTQINHHHAFSPGLQGMSLQQCPPPSQGIRKQEESVAKEQYNKSGAMAGQHKGRPSGGVR